MKKLLILIYIFTYSAMGQSLSVFDVDASNFPTIKAKFFAIDKDGKQLTKLTPSDFELKENGLTRTVTNVSCPAPKPPVALSSVLVVDISGSMSDGPPRIQSAKKAANAWIDGLPLGQSECALSSFNSLSNIIQDFTTSRDILKVAIEKLKQGGGTNYDQALIDLPAGGLQIAKNGKYKKVIVFLTDGMPNFPPKVNDIIKFANENQITIYAVTLDMPAPQCIIDITTQTGGQYFENITTIKEAEETYTKLLKSAQGGDPCEIEWQSSVSCNDDANLVELGITKLEVKSTASYQGALTSVAKLEFNPTFVKFQKFEVGEKVEKKITLTAHNSNFNITNITSNDGAFTVTPTNFVLIKGESIELTVSYLPTESGYVFAKIDIENDLCPTNYYASGTFFGNKPKIKTIKLLQPNGGEEFIVGSDTLITWEGIPATDTVLLEYSIDSGSTWKTITDKASEFKYIWKNIPNPTSSKCKVKISQRINLNGTKKAGDLLNKLSGDFSHTNEVKQISWNPDGYHVATASSDHTAKIWNVETGATRLTLKSSSWVNVVNWSPDGSLVVTTDKDNTVNIWDVKTGTSIQIFAGHKNWVNDVCWSPDGYFLATASNDNTARIWDVKKGASIHTLAGHTQYVNDVCWSPDGSFVATASKDFTVRIWDVKTGSIVHTLVGHTDEVNTVNCSLDGSLVASASDDNTVRIWDVKTGTTVHTLSGHTDKVNTVNWSPDGSFVASASDDNTARIWDVKSGTTIYTFNSCVRDVSWSPDGSLVATASDDNTARIWDVKSGTLKHTFVGHLGRINKVSWSPDGSRLATASWDNTARIWIVKDANTILQEDESDNVFSIVKSTPSASDIDMKQCLVGSSKDSVIDEFVQNKGTLRFRVDSIYFQGADANTFSLVSGFPKYILESNQKHFAEFRFTPNRVGIHSAEIIIVTQNDTLKQKISGVGLQPSLEIVNNLIDFGKEFITNYKDTIQVTTIKNIGNAPLTITRTTNGYPNDKDFTTISGGGSFTLGPNEIHKMDLRFTASSIGRTSGTLEFHYIGEGSPAIIQLFGEGLNRNPKIQSSITTFSDLICDTESQSNIEIKNIGGNDLVINELNVTGVNNLDFNVNQSLPIIIKPDSISSIPITFRPQSSGIKIADLEIKSNAFPDSVTFLQLSAKKDFSDYSLSSNSFNLGNLIINELAQQNLTIKNTGTMKTDYSLDITGNFQLSETNFSLLPDEQKEIIITFLGYSTTSKINENLRIIESVCSQQKNLNISGNVLSVIAEIQINNFEAYPGDDIIVPIILNSSENLKFAGVTLFNSELLFNPTLLSPEGYIVELIDENTAKISIENIPIDKLDGEILANIRFKVGLGNSESCKLTLSNAKSIENKAEIKVVDGKFTLLEICEEGVKRLVNPNSKAGIVSISPNPAENQINLVLSLSEFGNTEVCLYNILGEKVSTIYSENVTQKEILPVNSDLSKIGSGQYILIFRTPTYTETTQLLILR